MSDSADLPPGQEPTLAPWIDLVDANLAQRGLLNASGHEKPAIFLSDRGVAIDKTPPSWRCSRGTIGASYLYRNDAVDRHLAVLAFLAPEVGPDKPQRRATRNVPITKPGAREAGRLIAAFEKIGFDGL